MLSNLYHCEDKEKRSEISSYLAFWYVTFLCFGVGDLKDKKKKLFENVVDGSKACGGW